MERFFTGRELVNTSSRLERNAAIVMQYMFAIGRSLMSVDLQTYSDYSRAHRNSRPPKHPTGGGEVINEKELVLCTDA